MNLSRVFDQPGRDELLAAYRLASLRILDSLIHHALPAGDKSDYASFRENLSRVISKFEEGHAQPADILVCAGAASASIQEYHRHAVTALKGRSIELQAVVSLLTEAMAEVSAGSTRSVERLRHIEHRLSRSQELHDIRDLRQEMSACLADVREEAVSRQREAERIKASLQTAAPK